MLDIPSISAIVAAIGVITAAVYTYFEVRNLVKSRQADIVMRLSSTFGSKEYLEAWQRVRERETEDYNEYMKKYGFADTEQVMFLFEQLGVLLRRKLIDIDLVYELFGGIAIMIWIKFKALTETARSVQRRPDIFANLEYLYKEMLKTEQKLQQTRQ